jgi:hypothetical protein
MPDLDVRAGGEHAYDVTLTHDDGTVREYHVTVPEPLLADLGLDTPDEPLVVRQALELLMERDGATMPEQFSLADAVRTYPGFADQLRAAVLR